MKRICFIVFLGFIFAFSYLYNSTHIFAENRYIFPDNKEKYFVSARDFFKNEKITGYTEFKEANINFEQKLLYKDLQQFIKSNLNEYYYINLLNVYSNPNDNVSPNRQVYFYCFVLDNEKTFRYTYIILDAETTKPIAKGNGKKFKSKD